MIEKLERLTIDAELIVTDYHLGVAARWLGRLRVGLLEMMTRLGLR
jgi:hypothetical protein